MAILSPAYLGGGPAISESMNTYRFRGTSPFNVFYPAGVVLPTVTTVAALSVNQLYSYPYLSPVGGLLDSISFEVSAVGGGGSVTRVGIYNSLGTSNPYPGSLIVDGGEFDTATAASVKTATISVALGGNQLYWFSMLIGTAAATYRGAANSSSYLLALPAAMGAVSYNCITKSGVTYGAMPTTYPAGGVVNSASVPYIAVHYVS